MSTSHAAASTRAALEAQLTDANALASKIWRARFEFADQISAGNALRDLEAAGASVRPGRSGLHYVVEFPPGAVGAVAQVAISAGAIYTAIAESSPATR